MANPSEPVERTVIEQPATIRRVEIRSAPASYVSGCSGWWVAALVAVIALVGAFFLFGQTRNGEVDLQAARDSGRTEAMAAQAHSAAAAATRASADAAASVAQAGRTAADRAADAAEKTAQSAQNAAASAGDAAQDAADTATEPLK